MPEGNAADAPNPDERKPDARRRGPAGWWMEVTRRGLREPATRLAGHLGLLAVIALGVWAARLGVDALPVATSPQSPSSGPTLEPTATVRSELGLEDLPAYDYQASYGSGIPRYSELHTIIPSRPRLGIITYVVQKGDTLFGIADKFGLQPETILWGNFETLEDNPHNLTPGQELNILPVDGTLYQWHEGDSLNGVASFFGVTPEDVIDWPGNDLDPGIDPANPVIEPGRNLVVPGGQREFVSWRAPVASRTNPAVASVSGPGACGQIYDGAIGTGTFNWPTSSTWISGYGFSSYHPGIDIGGSVGNGIFAADSGVVVYAGWNYYGYGNLVMIDHGNGWQTLYAHLSSINVGCGDSVFAGNVIAAMGCTGNCSGPHLHFEMRNDSFGRVNPLLYLP